MDRKTYIVRNVRLDTELDDKILEIAKREERSISQVLQRLIRNAIDQYY